MRKRAAVCLVLFAVLAAQGNVLGGTIHVTPAGTDPSGASWATPTSLTNALAICTSGDEIWVAEGTYSGSAPFVAAADCTLYGGFTNGMATRAERDWDAYPTVLDGLGEARSVVSVTGGGVTLDGVEISNSTGGESYGTRSGIAMKVAGTLALANCRLVDHTTSARYHSGLAAYFQNATVLMTNCLVANNTQTYRDTWAAGVYVYDNTDLTLVDCLFTNNAYSGYAYNGTALAVNGGRLTAVRTHFLDNAPGGVSGDGAVYLANRSGTSAVFSNCVFRGNLDAADGLGGAMRVHLPAANSATLVNCTFTGNGVTGSGGYGGAIYLSAGTLNLRSCILWNNQVAAGGANGREIYVAGGTLNVRYSDLTGTASPYIAGGSGTFQSCLTSDPLFASPTDVHLQSTTGRWDPGAGAFVTTDGTYSPCLDAGDPSDAVGSEVPPNGARINIGAYGGTAEASKSAPNSTPQLADRGASVNYHRAEISGELTNGTYVTASVGLCYGASSVPGDTTNGWEYVEPFATAKHTGEVFAAWTPALAPSTTYYYRWYASNSSGSDWTTVATFNTLTAPPSGGADVIHVDQTATGGANDGSDWANAYLGNVSASLAVGGTRTNIWITGGTYTDGGTVSLPANATLIGGFEGTETAASQRALTNAQGVVTNYTVMDGEGQSRSVVQVTGGNVMIEAVEISNSTGGERYGTRSGIAMKVAGALTLANCRLVGHTTGDRYHSGLAAYFQNATVLMTNCLVANNTQSYRDTWGAGVYAYDADLTLVDCLFTNNAYSGYAYNGGALAVNGGRLRAVRTDFLDNSPGGSTGNGTVYLANRNGTSGVFSNCVFRGNRANANGYGGAMRVQLPAASSATLVNCTFTDNGITGSTGYGGAIYLSAGTLNIRNCILWTNRVATGIANGHEIYVAGGTLNVDYSDLTGTASPHIYGAGTFQNCLTVDPLFAGATDLHLRSTEGRWDPVAGVWTNDGSSSLCLDAGDPSDSVGAEPDPNGGTINLGRYGGTAEASKTPAATLPQIVDRGAVVNYHRAEVSGELTNDVPTTAQVGLCYGTNSVVGDTTNGWEYVDVLGASQPTGVVFSVSTPGLETTKTYTYRWFATNDDGIAWTPAATFLTGTLPPGGGSNVIHVNLAATGAADGTDWVNAYTRIADAVVALGGSRTNIWVTGDIYQEGAAVSVPAGTTLIGGFAGTETAVSQRVLTNAQGVVTNYTVIDGQGQDRSCVWVTGADVTLDTVQMSNSTGGETFGTKSGVAKKVAGALTLSNCRIIDHSSGTRDAAGIGAYFSAGTVLMTNCLVANCTQTYRDTFGAGVYANGADLTVVDCLFTNNGYGAGMLTWGTALAVNGGALTAVRSDFVSNPGSRDGGGTVYLANGAGTTAAFSNCVFRANQCATAGSGGAMRVNLPVGGTAEIVNCTFTENSRDHVSGYGGAIYLAAGTLSIRNSILWTNTVAAGSTAGQEIYVAGGTLNVTYSDLTGTASPYIYGPGTFQNCLTADPLFAGAGDVHLQSAAGRWDPAAGSFVTSDTAYSPCLDAGDPSGTVADEPAPNEDRVNLGAYGGTAQASKSPPSDPPELADRGAVVSYNRATVSGELTNSTKATAEVGLCYGTSSVPGDTTNGWEYVDTLGAPQTTGVVFSVTTPGLAATTTYYYRWYATNAQGGDWTAVATFDTGAQAPGGGAGVIHVDQAATGAADGTDWINAYTRIADGISALGGTRTNIWITGGSYAEGAKLVLSADACIVGGFEGTEAAVAERALTGAGGMVTNYTAIDGETTHTCLEITGGNASLDTLAVSNSATAGSMLKKSGSGALVMSNCRLEHNNMPGGLVARYLDGFGAYFGGGSVRMTDCVVANINQSYRDNEGLGIYSAGTDLTVVDCTFTNCRAGGSHVRGGALAFYNGSLVVRRSVFQGNAASTGSAGLGGGAVYLANSTTLTAAFSNCLFVANEIRASVEEGDGGAVWADLAAANEASFVNCTFTANSNGAGHGGACHVSQGTVNIKNCVLWSNVVTRAGYTGGDVYADGASSVAALDHTCVTGAGAPYVVPADGATVQWGVGMVAGDPLFEDPAAADYQLQRGSPCINAGITLAGMDAATDLAGNRRVLGGTVDMGAYESQPPRGTVFVIR